MKGVVVFVKNPEIGKVKTRLASSLGDEKALEIYYKLIDYTRKVLEEVDGVIKYVYYSSFIDHEDDWSNDVFEKRLQVDGGLGAKITSAMGITFETCKHVVIIGSDCPQLTATHIEDTFQKLKTNNIVVGPSHDGGYYLLGMDNYYPALFQGITWSSDKVYHETMQIAKSMDLEIDKLETLSDIDHEEDWVKYGF